MGLLLLHLELSTCPLWVTVPSYLDVLARKAIIFAFYFALKQKVCVQIFYSLFSMISFCLFTFYFFVTMYPNCTIVDNILFVVFFESLCFLPLYTFKKQQFCRLIFKKKKEKGGNVFNNSLPVLLFQNFTFLLILIF